MTNPNIPNAAEIKEALRLLHYSSDLHPNDKRIKPLVALANQYLSGELIRKAGFLDRRELLNIISGNNVPGGYTEEQKILADSILKYYIPKAGLPTEEELLEIIRGTELYRMSNYVGKTKSFFNKPDGEHQLVHAIHTRLEGGGR